MATLKMETLCVYESLVLLIVLYVKIPNVR